MSTAGEGLPDDSFYFLYPVMHAGLQIAEIEGRARVHVGRWGGCEMDIYLLSLTHCRDQRTVAAEGELRRAIADWLGRHCSDAIDGAAAAAAAGQRAHAREMAHDLAQELAHEAPGKRPTAPVGVRAMAALGDLLLGGK